MMVPTHHTFNLEETFTYKLATLINTIYYTRDNFIQLQKQCYIS